ncbi:hypothetical protein ACWEF9_29930 [Streptomyces sp. NPDC004980]
MDTEWAWLHHSDENPTSSLLCTGENYPTQAEARQTPARYIPGLGSPKHSG